MTGSHFMKNHARSLYLGISLLTLGLVLSISAWAKDEAQAPTETKAALAVAVTLPTEQSWNSGINASGTLAPWQEAVIAAEIGGQQIVKLSADVGDRVKKGQELALLSQEAVQADIAQVEARVAQAEASLTEATTNAERARRLKESGALPAQQIDQYLTGENTAKAALAAQKAALVAQQIRLKQTKIVAVDDGVITARTATLGSVVQPGTELFRLVRQNRLEWKAELPGADLARVEPGQTARLILPTGETVQGKVRLISPTLDTNTRNALAYVSLPVDSPARAGMFANGEILTGSSKSLSLPQSAVILRDGNTYAFEVSSDNHIVQRLLKTGRRADGQVEIVDGIKADARIVISGGAFLNEGDIVQVVDKQASTNSSEAKP